MFHYEGLKMPAAGYSQFVELTDEDGNRNLVRVAAIQRVCDVDEMQTEAYLTVAGRTILVRASFDEIREILMPSHAKLGRGGAAARRARRA
jgi:hypothetical protein